MTLPKPQRRPYDHAMIHEIAVQRSLPKEIVRAIAQKADGVPLYIEELTRTVVDRGLAAIMADLDTCRTRSATPGHRLPLGRTGRSVCMGRPAGGASGALTANMTPVYSGSDNRVRNRLAGCLTSKGRYGSLYQLAVEPTRQSLSVPLP